MAADPAAIQSVDQLVQAREARGLAQSDLAARLGMVPRQIQAIERADWRALPGRSFARSALRAYGRAVSVNVESLLVAIDAEYGVDGEPINRPALDQPIPRRGVLGFSASGSGHWLTWTVLAVVGLIVVAFFFGGGASLLDLGDSSGSSPRTTATTASPVADASRNASSPVPTAAPLSSGSGSSISGSQTLPAGTQGLAGAQAPLPGLVSTGASVAGAPPSGSAGGTPPPSGSSATGLAGSSVAGLSPSSVLQSTGTAPSPLQSTAAASLAQPVQASGAAPLASSDPAPVGSSSGLVLRFSGDSWIEIRDAADRIVATGTQPGGTTRSFDIPPPVSGVIGNVGAVSVTWRGAAFDLAPFIRQGVARFRIERGDQ